MAFSSLFLCSLLVAAPYAGAQAGGDHTTSVYTVDLEPIGDISQVTGRVVVFAANGGIIGYDGTAVLNADLMDTTCADVNGCGVHIHSGTSCFNTTTQGGHYYEDPVLSDPWTNKRYDPLEATSDGFYVANFKGIITIGTTDLDGRVFVVHGQDGSRVACGILEKTTENVMVTETEPLGDSNVTASITSISIIKEVDQVCFFGMASGLERDLVSANADPAGTDCTAGNGCGVHVHSGTACTDSTTQGGHFYATADDPWSSVGYRTTDADGQAMFLDCVSTGEIDTDGRPFVVHANDGSRVSCGLLMPAPDETASPTAAPASSVGKCAPLASALAMLTTAVIAVTF